MGKKWITISEASTLMRVSPPTVRKIAREQCFPVYMPGRNMKLRLADVLGYINDAVVVLGEDDA